MTPAARERLRVRVPLLAISAAAWVIPTGLLTGLVAGPGHTAAHDHASMAVSGTMAGAMPMAHPLWSFATGWALMLIAMMAPLLIAPVRHVHDRSFARRRGRAILLFVAGYAAIWMAAGGVLLALARAIRSATPGDVAALALTAAIALVWQFSPSKQLCLNRGHAHPPLTAFGSAADLDALRFGWTHGVWCVGSCWALMLLPLLVSSGHLAAGHLAMMAAVTLWLCAERFDRPVPPRWCVRGPGKAMRLAVAQAQTRLQVG